MPAKRTSVSRRSKPKARVEPALSAARPAAGTRPGGGRARARRRGALDRALGAAVRFMLRWIWLLGSRFALGVALILGAATLFFYAQLPPAEALLDGRARGSVTLLDRDGQVFAWRGQQYGGAIRAGELSPHLVNAVIATEDRRFWRHWGVDPLGLARAMAANLRAGRLVQGGSTLTQQTAKNVFLTQERSLERKLKELPMALAMEMKYTKEEILSIYLNRVYLGAGAYGFEAAAQRYFGKSARVVTPAEAAMLAGLLKAPSRYAPTSDLSQAQNRAQLIIGLMEEQGYLTPVQAAEARAHPATLSRAAAARAGGAFADWVMEEGPAYLTEDTREDVRIATTFDPRIQRAAEEALAHVFETRVRPGSRAQAAIVVMSPDGAVRAIVGGREPSDGAGRFNRATQAKRQTGSAFKPVVYAAALEAGRTPWDVVEDRPVEIDGWRPRNYGGDHAGPVTLTEALARSINTVAVRLAQEVGMARVAQTARRLGIESPLAPGLASALGTSEATLLEMTGAYAAIAAEGRRTIPYGIREIRLMGDPAPLMRREPPAPEQAVSAMTARRLTGMLEEVIRSGTGRRAALPDRPAAGKTGTTQAARDAWFIGFTADYVAGVWMGYDDNTSLSGVTGGGLPAEIWRETMMRIHDGLPPRSLDSERAPPAGGPQVPGAIADALAESLAGRILSDVVGFFTREAGGAAPARPAPAGARPERPERIER
ncbi:PBP1A family penicillin-binding protein [Oceanicella actignis]|uniref:transglycosylase domain-containing protein n=1 Tax=Oceanicella actignis TaxID=1189325 RepID=UPI0009FA79CC